MQSSRNDFIMTIDLHEVLNGPDEKQIALAPRANCEADDFEDWTTATESGAPQCVLGKLYTWHRVKPTQRSSGCFLPKDYTLQQPTAKVRRPSRSRHYLPFRRWSTGCAMFERMPAY
jgi:hypothetical protein